MELSGHLYNGLIQHPMKKIEKFFVPGLTSADQGHNPQGVNAGAEGNGLREQDVTYVVGRALADMLRDDPRFAVRLSRNTPTESLGTSNATSLAARVRMANSWPANYFVSIHCNSNPNPAINGSEVYVYQEGTQAFWLGQHIIHGLVQEAGTRDNGVRVNPSLYVLRKTSMPAVPVELGYLSNPGDAMKLRDDPRSFARGIYVGMLSYFGFAQI